MWTLFEPVITYRCFKIVLYHIITRITSAILKRFIYIYIYIYIYIHLYFLIIYPLRQFWFQSQHLSFISKFLFFWPVFRYRKSVLCLQAAVTLALIHCNFAPHGQKKKFCSIPNIIILFFSCNWLNKFKTVLLMLKDYQNGSKKYKKLARTPCSIFI